MKKSVIASAILLATAAANVQAAAWQSEDGRLTIGGDVEINFDVIENKNGVTQKTIPQAGSTPKTTLGDDSRVMTEIKWMDTKEDGSYITAAAQPLLKANGDVKLDDSYFAFGRKDSWMFQIGRYEAMDLFPLGKDTMLVYAAGSDGIGNGVYYYMGKEARGRTDDAGQARVVGEMGNWTAEVSTVYGDTKSILEGSLDHIDGVQNGNSLIASSSDSFMIRPAVNYLSESGDVSVSFGGEWEANSDSVKAELNGVEKNVSDRYGLSATTTLMFGDLAWNISAAYQDAKELWKAQTYNTNIIYNAFGLGASYAVNDYVESNKEDAKSWALYTAYTVPVMDFDNAEVTFALSYSETENAFGTANNDEKTTAFRTRFNYYF